MRLTRVLLLLCVVLLGWTVPAQAHTALVSSDPADGTHLDAPPEQIVLTFTENLREPSEASVVVSGEAATTAARVDGPRLVVPVPEGAADGAYEVNYRVVSADGHPVTGTVSFTVGDVEAASPVDDATDEGDFGVGTALWWALGLVVVIIVAGILVWRGRRS